MQALSGGIYREKNNVIRTLDVWSPTIHQLLNHLALSKLKVAMKY